jgi:DNA-binding FadR family transcriptional regulator
MIRWRQLPPVLWEKIVDAGDQPPSAGVAGAAQRPGYQTAAGKIAELIRTAGLRPGDRLPTERDLGAQLGVSRTVVREAIKVLTTAGLVRARHGSGLYVAEESIPFVTTALNFALPADPEHILNLFEFRCTLETQTARLAAERITPRELHALEESIALQWRMLDGYQPEAGEEAEPDAAFHRGIAAATHNDFFTVTVSSIFRLQGRAIALVLTGAPGSFRVAAEQHGAILEAIRRGRPEEAARAMEIHVQTVRAAYQHEVRRLLNSGAHTD